MSRWILVLLLVPLTLTACPRRPRRPPLPPGVPRPPFHLVVAPAGEGEAAGVAWRASTARR